MKPHHVTRDNRPARILTKGLPRLLMGLLALALGTFPVMAAGGHDALLGVWIPERSPDRLLTLDGKRPPLTPEAAELYEKRIGLLQSGDTSFDRATWCAGPGMPRIMFMPYPFEIRQDGDYIAFIYGWFRWHRLVDMAGGSPDIPFPITMGFATGNWDGDTLVIHTQGLSDVTVLDPAGLPHSDDMVMTERLRVLPDGRLEDRFTIQDPASYQRPWETVMTYRRAAGVTVKDDICPDRMARGEPAVRETNP